MAEKDPISVIAAALKEQAGALKRHLKKARSSSRPKDIHQARVALRRLREALELAAHISAPDERLLSLKKITKKLLSALSELRTQDALLGLLGSLSTPQAPHARELLRGQLKKRRARKQKEAQQQLEEKKQRSLPRRVRRLAPSLSLNIKRPGLAVEELLRLRLSALSEHLSLLPKEPSTEPLHRARILIKRLRYTRELAQHIMELAPSKQEQLQRAQELGGHFHDLELLSQAADELSETTRHPEALLLNQQLARLARESRDNFRAELLSLKTSLQDH